MNPNLKSKRAHLSLSLTYVSICILFSRTPSLFLNLTFEYLAGYKKIIKSNEFPRRGSVKSNKVNLVPVSNGNL